jgi:hypothetical protein
LLLRFVAARKFFGNAASEFSGEKGRLSRRAAAFRACLSVLRRVGTLRRRGVRLEKLRVSVGMIDASVNKRRDERRDGERVGESTTAGRGV